MSPKKVVHFSGWHAKQNHHGMLHALVVLEAQDRGIYGITLDLTARRGAPDRQVSIQLCLDEARKLPISRVDWRPSAPHTNKRGSPLVRGLQVWTSVHSFAENAALGLEAMVTENLPIAIPLKPEPADFNELLVRVCELFQIDSLRTVETPPWAPSFFD